MHDIPVIGYLPNLLTVLRIAAVPVIVVLLENESYDLALLLFLAAGISDGLDGYIAKRFHCQTRLGAILDPIADKLLLVSGFGMLTLLEWLPFWLLVTVVFRDLLIVGGYMVLVALHGSVQMRPSFLSKANTVFQISLVGVVLAQAAAWFQTPIVVDALIVVVSVTTVLSGAHYVWVWGLGKEQDATGADSGQSE